MDEFLEQMLSASSWGDGVSLNRASWDAATVNAADGMSIDPTGELQGLPKMATIPTMPSAPLVGGLENQGLNRAPQDQGNGSGHVGEDIECPSREAALSPQFKHQDALFESIQAPQDATHISLQKFSEGSATGVSAVSHLNANAPQSLPSIGGCPPRGPLMLESNSFEGSGFQQTTHNLQGSTLMAPTWRQPYIGSVPPLPSALSQGNPDTFSLHGETISNGVHPGKRSRDEEDCLRESHQRSMIHVAQLQGVQQGQGHEDQSPLAQNPAGNTSNGVTRPRVRARRGQATDPHSIAERNRRERIAERMKALQELVPDSNKTDKASMLDEIIGYVKFLQMQVKCLSMCRLGGAGAAAPLFADLPAEGAGNFIAASLAQASGAPGPSQDGIAFAERQVARLMDEDMSAAMQYLQSKGLCLMPISLATAISSTGTRQQSTPIKGSDSGGNEKQAMELQVVAATGSTNPAVMATLANSGVSALGNGGIVNSGGNMLKTLRGMPKDDKANEEASNQSLALHSITIQGGLKNREDPQRGN